MENYQANNKGLMMIKNSVENSKDLSARHLNIMGVVGSILILAVIAGGIWLPDIFAFWKYEGNVPGLIEGGNYIIPLNLFLIRMPDLPDITSSELSILLAIYLPFIIVGIIGLIGSLGRSRRVMGFAGFIGACAVPLSIFVTAQQMVTYEVILPGMEWTGLLDFYHVLGSGTYTMALWTGFFGCAIGSYLIYFGRPKVT